MLRAVAYFKHLAASSVINEILVECNQLIGGDYGSNFRLAYMPDLLMVARNSDNHVVGLLILHHMSSTRAWEVGTVASLKKYNRDEMLKILIKSADGSLRSLQAKENIEKTVWMVKRVKHSDAGQRTFFEDLGFVCPDNWVENVLSDEGYIPFDPFDTSLMKRVVQA